MTPSHTTRRAGSIVTAFLVTMALLPAAPATAVPADTPVTIEGGGWGHGIGMSQYGTLGMAEDGHSYDEILRYWYSDTGLNQVSNLSGVPDPVRVGINYVLVGTERQFRPFLWQDFRPVNGNVSVCLPGQSQGSCSLTARPGETWRYRWWNESGGFCEITRDGVRVYSHATNCNVRLFWSDQPNTRVSFPGGDVARTFARGHIEFLGPKTVNGRTGFHLVIVVSLEEYVYGIAEVSPAWHMEALKTQVVAARTYGAWRAGVWKGGVRGDCSCQLVWDTFDQAYRGWHNLTEGNSTLGHRWRTAVDDTAGQVVVYPAGSTTIAQTFYSSSTGGATENVWDVWGPDTATYRATYAYLATRPDPWSERYASQGWGIRWTRNLTAGFIAGRLGFDDHRIATGYINPLFNELAFLWTSNGNGGNRPQSYVRVQVFNPSDRSNRANEDIFHTLLDFAYPAVGLNRLGHAGLVMSGGSTTTHVTTFAMISVSAGYGSDGSSTPTTVAVRISSLIVLPITDGSRLSDVAQNRYVRTAAPVASGPSSLASSSRPSTGRRPITSK